jgi:hypothetical protein
MKSDIDMGYVRTAMEKMKLELKLATHWQNRMSEYLGQGTPSLTGRQVGQIKSLYFKTGMLSRRIIDFAFENWDQLTTLAMEVSAVPTCPNVPHIGYLLTHREEAMALMVAMKVVPLDEVELALEVAQNIDWPHYNQKRTQIPLFLRTTRGSGCEVAAINCSAVVDRNVANHCESAS